MGANAATIGGLAPKTMQDVVPPYAKALHGGSVVTTNETDPEPLPMPIPEPPASPTPPAPEAPGMPETPPPDLIPAPKEPPATIADVPVAREQAEPAEPMFPQVQAVENSQPAPVPLTYTPKPQAEDHTKAHHIPKLSNNWVAIGLAVAVVMVLAAVAVMAMRG